MKAYARGQKPSRKAVTGRLPGRDVPVREYPVLLTGNFDKGTDYSCWRSRGSRDWLLFFTLRGAGRIANHEAQRATTAGDLIFCPPRQLHDYGTDLTVGKWHFLWVHFHPQPEWLGWLAQLPPWDCGWLGARVPQSRWDQIQVRLEEINTLISQGGPLEARLAVNALEDVILRAALYTREATTTGDRRTESALAFIAQNYRRPLSLTEIAGASQQSISRLKETFRKQVGVTVGEYLEKRRLNRAAELLRHTSLTVKEIAGEVGFVSPFHFSARFARFFGKSPRAYRLDGDGAQS